MRGSNWLASCFSRFEKRRKRRMYLHGTSRINERGHLEIGGVDTVDLAKQYGTPLYVYDVAVIREKANAFKKVFQSHGGKNQIAYASKAFSCIAMVQLARELVL